MEKIHKMIEPNHCFSILQSYMKSTYLLTSLAFAITVVSTVVADDKATVIAQGKQKFIICGACHGLDGKGMSPAPGITMAPSFVDSKLVKVDAEVMALIMLKGIKKENPAEFMGQMMMPLGATMEDSDVAAIITYVQSEFGKMDVPVVTAEQVAEWRKAFDEQFPGVAPAPGSQPLRAELEKMAAEKNAE